MPLLSKTRHNAFSKSALRMCLPVGGALLMTLASLPPALAQSGKGGGTALSEAETARRLEAQERAQTLVTEGDALAVAGQHCGAADNYQAAAQALRPGAPATAALRAEAVKKFARSGVACARELASKGAYDQARTRLTALLADDMAPNDKPALKLLEQLDDPDRHNPALTPLHADNVDKVNKLLLRAEHFTELGQFDAAEAAYNQVLAIDATNTAARRGMERVQRHITEYYKSARDENRLRMLNAVDRTWEAKVPSLARMKPIAAGEDLTSGGGTVSEKLRAIMLPRLSLSEASIADAVAHLRQKSIELDPEPDERLRGVNIIWNGAGGEAAQPVNVDLRNVALGDALRAVCDAAGVRFRSDGAIIIVSRTGGGGMETRQFRVPPGFLSTAASALPTDTAASDPFAAPDPAASRPKIGRLDARTYLENNGVQFPEGARAGYNPSANLLTVTNTSDNLELVASLMDTELTKTQRQVLVRTLLLKTSQQNLRELGGDMWLGAFNVGGERVFGAGGTYGNQQNGLSVTAPGNFGTSSFTPINIPLEVVQGPVTAGLRSSYELTRQRNIDDLIAVSNSTSFSVEQNRSPFIGGIGGFFTDPQFLAMLRALDQKKGVDLSVANEVIVKSGQKATAFSGRDFNYPTEFDPPQIPQTVAAPQFDVFDPDTGIGGTLTGQLGQAPVTPATPSSFDTRQIGSGIEVEPTIGDDGYTVDLNLAVTFTEFGGFINYGTPIISNNENSSQNSILTDNRIIQPVFSKTSANAQVLIYDGQTIAIGGMTNQKTETVEDAVPVFSKIPLIGKFFTTDMVRDSRMAVVYFVTVRVVDPAGENANAAAQLTAPADPPPADLPFDPALLDAVRADGGK